MYLVALEHFGVYLKYEKNPRMAETVRGKYKEYLVRAEELQKIVQGQKNAKEVSGTGASGAQREKRRRRGRGRGVGEDEGPTRWSDRDGKTEREVG